MIYNINGQALIKLALELGNVTVSDFAKFLKSINESVA